ncbi:hypothetical protein Q2T42_01275 [Leptolyngbya boryana CZ1]|uniref:DUF6603 domain-containing protein n=1 Tax=Leptolyngbya boryana CZ1 TaxID=3060204 RepID=A0AA96WVN9_LEPBY|nr:DUF6603 domain-containing protein [Leptolyngbya boryana]WNZ46467.1 hypothetical protein Q2T42_01275 [Leptolyngbya boryana CZ1]
MPQQDALQSILTETSLAIAPLRSIRTPDQAIAFFRQLGFELPAGAGGSSLTALATQAGELVEAIRQLLSASGEGAVASAIATVFARLGTTVDAIAQFKNQVQSSGGASIPNIDDLPRRLTDFLLLDYLMQQKTQVHEALLLLGLIEHEPAPAAGQTMRRINWDRLGTFFTNPIQIANAVYAWESDFDTDKFLARLERLMRSASLPGGRYTQSDTTRTVLGNSSTTLQDLRFPLLQKGFTAETYSQFGITIAPVQAQAGKPKGVALLPYLLGGAAFEFGVCDRGELVFESTADIQGVGLIVRPPLSVEGILNLVGAFRAAVTIREKTSRADEIVLIGSPGGTRLAVQGLGVSWFAQNPRGELDLGMAAEIGVLRLVVAGGEGDGFLQQILSSLNVQAEASLALGITLLSGFTFQGGAKLALELAVHLDLGLLQIQGLRLALEPAADRFNVEAGAVLKLSLGPLQAVVENIGVQAALVFRQGNLGSTDLAIDFKPPNGVGLSVDAGVVKGGGYLFFDFDREEYAGALELVFSGFLTLKAIGLITTKMPDGSKGFSLLIIITAEFGTGLQLGFGFTLLGVGGLLGLNRTMQLQPLVEGVRTGALNSILFPRDVIANAPRILSDLRTFFPLQQGKFLIGPMAKLGWGTPTLISLSLGIIIEIPGNIAILGVLRVALPTEEAALLVLQVSFIGAIEFDKKRIYFFATLFESRILFLTLEGEMGLLVAYGDDPNFVVSVGGFHPRFNPPPLPFPSPNRISVNILNESNARIRVMNYFAVTSNTVQFGARAELFFGFSAFSVEGHIGYDALIQFSPFYFIIEISASVSLKVFGAGVFTIRLQFSLEGPTPWRARGTGYLSILFFEISADFDITWGEKKDTTLPPVPAMPILKAEFEKLQNWRAILPPENNLFVSLRKLDPSVELVLHPVGMLRISQKAVPLDVAIDKVGTQKVSDAKRFSVEVASGGLAKTADVTEQFAIAQFQNLDDASKLSRRAYDPLTGGLDLSAPGKALRSSKLVRRRVRYEEIIIDSNYKRFIRRFRIFNGVLFIHFLGSNSISQSVLSKAYRTKLQPFKEKVAVREEAFVVAFQANNQAFQSTAQFNSQTQALAYLQRQVNQNPDLYDRLHVIPQHEVNR